MRFDIAMDDSQLMQIGDDSDDLQRYPPAISIPEHCLALVKQVEKRALLHQLHDEAQLRRCCNGSKHEHDVGMAIFGQHVHLVVELAQ